jgi:ABC-2 type transport system ATP-binding protein
VIQVREISKRFGEVRALERVSFEVRRGEVVGFLGPNGAGKTTTLRVLAGFLAPDAGNALVDGIDVQRDSRAARARLGYLPESCPLHAEMRVVEYLRFRARLKDVPRRELHVRVDRALELAGAADMARRPCGHLSKGYRQRVGLADALLGRPPVLLLDEPTAGLDPNQIRETRALVRSLAAEHAVLLSSHILPEVEAVADRVVILVRGRVVAEDRPDALRARLAAGAIAVQVAPADVEKARAALPGAEIVDAAAGRLRVPGAAAEDVVRALVAAGSAPREVRPEERTLEDVFTELTR